jgi:hypothetical protein
MDTVKIQDRYNFNYEFSQLPDGNIINYYFKLYSSLPIYEVKNSNYAGHFVIGNKYWVDFNTGNKEDIVIIGRGGFDDTLYYYDVNILSYNTKLNFQSLGALNEVCQTSTYYYEIPPSIVNITNPICNAQYTLSTSQNTNITFNWSNSILYNSLNITYNLSIKNSILQIINSSIPQNNNYYNWQTNANLTTSGNYNNRVNTCDSNGYCTFSNSTCTFNICTNNWVIIPQPCTDELRYTNYTDTNNCNAQYDLPNDANSYVFCVSQTNIQLTNINNNLTFIGVAVLIVALIIYMVFKNKKEEK